MCENGRIPFNKIFQLVTLIDVIIYVEDYELYLKELSKMIADGGYLVASCTNRISIFVYLRLLKNIFFEFKPKKLWFSTQLNLIRTGIWSGGHVNYRKSRQIYSSCRFDKLLKKLGFKKVDELNLFKINMLDKNPLHRKGLIKIIARHFGWNHIGVYKKVKGV